MRADLSVQIGHATMAGLAFPPFDALSSGTMAFSIRRSVRVGPLRFNLSKSGIGVSTGIPGLRVGIGPRGNYIQMGRGGLSYRRTLVPSVPQQPPLDRRPAESNLPPSGTHSALHEIGSGAADEMSDTNSEELLSEIERKRQRFLVWPIVLGIAIVTTTLLLIAHATPWIVGGVAFLLCLAVVPVYQYDQLKKCVVLMYELDGRNLSAYEQLHGAVGAMEQCASMWRVTARGDVYNQKYHAGAGQLVTRTPFTVEYRDPPYVRTNLTVPRFSFGQNTLYLLPDRMLVHGDSGFGAVDYASLKFDLKSVPFIEEGVVPSDASVVGSTWKYVNKDGGPDRRFNNNPQIPICQYDEVQVTSGSGIHEVLQLSRVGVSSQLRAAAAEIVDSIQAAVAAEAERRRVEALERRQRTVETQARITKTVSPVFVSKLPPTPSVRHAAFFEIVCCVMVADKRVSAKEMAAIRDVMKKVGSGWSHDECDARIEAFIAQLRQDGYVAVVDRALSKLPMFVQVGYEKILLESIDKIAIVDGELSDRERELCDRIRKTMGLPPRIRRATS